MRSSNKPNTTIPATIPPITAAVAVKRIECL